MHINPFSGLVFTITILLNVYLASWNILRKMCLQLAYLKRRHLGHIWMRNVMELWKFISKLLLQIESYNDFLYKIFYGIWIFIECITPIPNDWWHGCMEINMVCQYWNGTFRAVCLFWVWVGTKKVCSTTNTINHIRESKMYLWSKKQSIWPNISRTTCRITE